MASQTHERRTPLLSPRAALGLGCLGFLFEALLISPWIDRAADANATVHFTQHGLIFVGGVLMGWALRDLRLSVLLSQRR